MLVEILSTYDVPVESNLHRHRKTEHQTKRSLGNELRLRAPPGMSLPGTGLLLDHFSGVTQRRSDHACSENQSLDLVLIVP